MFKHYITNNITDTKHKHNVNSLKNKNSERNAFSKKNQTSLWWINVKLNLTYIDTSLSTDLSGNKKLGHVVLWQLFIDAELK